MKRPVIGVTPLWDEEKDSLWMLPGYFEGIELAGGIPLMLPLNADETVLRQIAGSVDGVLFTGGPDVEPALYGQERLALCDPPCPERDAMERALFAEAMERDLAIFGICRGLQLMNALLGGTLHQDISSQLHSTLSHKQQPPYDNPAHEVTLLRGTPLHSLLGQDTLQVNSLHHQGVQALAPGFAAMAQAEDGLVEAAYMPGRRFVWAVQWHPEFMNDAAASRALFGAFVEACR